MPGQPILSTWLARCVSNIPLCPEGRPLWLRTDRLLGEWGILMDSAAARQQFALHIEARRMAEQTGDLSALPRKKAERILAEELQRGGWDFQRLEHVRKADPEKLKIAARLRAETAVTLKRITGHLGMGVPGYVSDCLRTSEH